MSTLGIAKFFSEKFGNFFLNSTGNDRHFNLNKIFFLFSGKIFKAEVKKKDGEEDDIRPKLLNKKVI